MINNDKISLINSYIQEGEYDEAINSFIKELPTSKKRREHEAVNIFAQALIQMASNFSFKAEVYKELKYKSYECKISFKEGFKKFIDLAKTYFNLQETEIIGHHALSKKFGDHDLVKTKYSNLSAQLVGFNYKKIGDFVYPNILEMRFLVQNRDVFSSVFSISLGLFQIDEKLLQTIYSDFFYANCHVKKIAEYIKDNPRENHEKLISETINALAKKVKKLNLFRGCLKIAPEGLIYIPINKMVGDLFFKVIEPLGFKPQSVEGKFAIGCHISVIRSPENRNRNLLLKETFEPYNFKVLGFDRIKKNCWAAIDEIAIITVQSLEIEKFRKNKGLSRLIQGNHKFHFTVGVKPRQIN